MGSRRRTYTDLVDVVSYTYIFQYKNSSGSWVNIGSSTSVNLGTVSASGGSSSISIRHYREKYVNGMFTSNETADLSYSLPSGVTKTQSGSVSNDYVSIFSYSYGNNTSTSSRTLSMSITCNGNKITASMSQSAGSKSYGSWSSWSVSVSNSGSVSASGGSSTISRSASRYRVWTWNGVAGSGSTEYEYGTPQLSVTSGSGTLSGTTLSYGNNTSTSSRSTRVTGKYSGASDYTDVVQSAGSKQYGSWGAWSISLSASPTTIAAAGGSATITRSATRTRTWTWNGVSGSGGTETGTGTPTLSKVSGNATLSGTTVTYSNNTSTSSRSSVIRATMDSITKDITISQSAGSKVNSYSDWGVVYRYRTAESWIVFPSVALPTGGDTLNLIIDSTDISHAFSQIVYVTIRRTNTWTWNGVSGSGGTEYEYDSDTSMSVHSYSGTSASCYYDSSAGSYKVVSGVSAPTGHYISEAVIIKLSSPVGGKSYFTITNIRQSTSPTAIGRLVIKNTRFTTSNLALPVQVGSERDTIYDGEAAYLKIYDNSNGVYIYLPTGATLSKGGSLNIWFEDINAGSKYSCTMSNTSTPNNYVRFSNANSIINVLVLNNASDYTIVGQCSMKSNSVTFNIRILIEP